ncbi:MAG: esterase/lipase family protein, partial [Tepidisphaerales bacterium]
MAVASPAAPPDPRETVVLLHGVAMPAFVMHRIATGLGAEGYRVVNLDYPSRRLTLEEIAADYLPAQLAAQGVAGAPR